MGSWALAELSSHVQREVRGTTWGVSVGNDSVWGSKEDRYTGKLHCCMELLGLEAALDLPGTQRSEAALEQAYAFIYPLQIFVQKF